DVEGVAPFAPVLFLNDTDFADPFGSAGVPNPFPAAFGPSVPGPDAAFPLPVSIFAVISRHFRSPQTITWNLTVERQLGSNWVFRGGYVGTKGTYLFGESSQKSLTESNPAIFRPGATIGNTQERRIDPNFGPVGYVASGNNSNYHALQLNLEKRFGLGFSLLTNYTWSKQLDDFGGGYLQTNPFIRAFDHGRSNEDLSGIWKLSGIWNIPSFHTKTSSVLDKLLNGWVIATSTVWRGGFPMTIFSGLDNSFSGVGFDRVDL